MDTRTQTNFKCSTTCSVATYTHTSYVHSEPPIINKDQFLIKDPYKGHLVHLVLILIVKGTSV